MESESFVLSFGSYIADIEPDSIDMGIVICTSEGEERVIRTLNRIELALSDDRHDMFDKIIVYVIDNGRTLNSKVSDHKNIKVISNRTTATLAVSLEV